MKISYTGVDRKELVKAISALLDLDSKYLGIPSASYQVGNLIIDKAGTVTGPDDRDLICNLVGCYSIEAVCEEYETPLPETEEPRAFEDFALTFEEELGAGRQPRENYQGENGMQASDVPFDVAIGPDTCDQESENATDEADAAKPDKRDLPRLYTLDTPRGEIYIAEEFATCEEALAEGYGEYFTTALGIVYGYGDDRTFALVTSRKAGSWDDTKIGRDFRSGAAGKDAGQSKTEDGLLTIEYPLSDFTPEKLANLNALIESKAALLKQSLGTEDLPIRMTDDTLLFPWFRSVDPEAVSAYTILVDRLCVTAKKKTRVTAKAREDFSNPRYSFRVWLLGLGMIGPEFQNARKILLHNLSGNSAFSGGKMPTYTVNCYTLENGGEEDPMLCESFEYHGLAKAKAHAKQFREECESLYFAGVHVENENGDYLYEITMDGTVNEQ